ncbi:MAG: DUF2148 domain-containing protein [Ignisphaera sp.]
MLDLESIKREVIVYVAKLIAISALTAPKARGYDNITIKILDDAEEIERLANKMEELSSTYGDFFKRDAQSIRKSLAVILIGCKIVDMGLKTPQKWNLDANVVNSLINLGIAIGSAVKTASIHNVDNRVMFSAGVAAQELGLIEGDIVYAIPLTASAKNPYFDRVFKT